MNDIVVKVGLVILGSMFSLLTGLLIWGVQRLASTIMDFTSQLAQLSTKVAHVEAYVERVQKLEKDVNHFYARLKVIEEKEEEI